MPITRTTTRVVASAQISDDYGVQIQLGDRTMTFNTDDALAFAEEIMDVILEAQLKGSADRPRAAGHDGPQLAPIPGLHRLRAQQSRPTDGGDAA